MRQIDPGELWGMTGAYEFIEPILRVEDFNDYPQIAGVLAPAAEQVIRDAVGDAWVTAHASDPTVAQVYLMLIATWFDKPEAFGELTPGANFLLTQLQARALGGDASG